MCTRLNFPITHLDALWNNDLCFYQVSVAGKIACKKCNSDLGNIIKYANVFLPTIKASVISFSEKGKGQPRIGKKWAAITSQYFVVNPISSEDLYRMACRLCEEIEAVQAEMNGKCLEAEKDQWEEERLKNDNDEEGIEDAQEEEVE